MLPKPIYDMLPYCCVLAGVLLAGHFDSKIGIASAVILAVAGLRIFQKRLNNGVD